MADYSQVNDYSAKDALSTGDPLKLIKGSDIDAEFSALSTAVASKFDSTDVATAGEAQAGTNNTKVITPARLTAWGQNGAGVIEDVQALADPEADRILFWDDSANTTTWMTISTGLTLTGTTLTVNEGTLTGWQTRNVIAGAGMTGGGDLSVDRTLNVIAGTGITVNADDIATDDSAIVHDNLSGFVANEHIDHTSVSITTAAESGLTGGGTLAATRNLSVDINGTSEGTVVAPTNDYVMMYDASATANKKVQVDAFVGTALGDGKWYKSTTTALSTSEVTAVFNTADNDSLTLGTFDTAAGTYTAGSAGARILVATHIRTPSLGSGEAVIMRVQVDGTDQETASSRRNTVGDNNEKITTILNLAAAEVVRVRVGMVSGTATADSGVAGLSLSIQELG